MQKENTRHTCTFEDLSSNYSFSRKFTDKKPTVISQQQNPYQLNKEVK